jgi:hypothetical protein
MLTFAIRILEGMFAVGVVGSALVVILTSIDDIRPLFSRDDERHSDSDHR